MGVNKNVISNLSKDKYTIKSKSTSTINFMGASPNYYRITNGGATPLYLGVSMSPTEDFFDMKIPSGTTKLFVDAYGHHEIYIFNPSVSDANIIITSFNADFEPDVLALSDIGQDFSQIDFSGEVDATGDLKILLNNIEKSIKAEKSIPEGSNVIGKVGLDEASIKCLKDIQMELGEVWNTTEGTSTIRTAIQDTYDKVKKIQQILDNNNDVSELGTILQLLGQISTKINDTNSLTKCTKFIVEENTEAENLYTFSYIELLSNDGDTDINLVIAGNRFILKPNEVINKMLLDGIQTVKIPKNSTYRIIGG